MAATAWHGIVWREFGVLVGARTRMAANSVQSSTGRQRLLIGILSAGGLLFAAGVGVLAAALLTLAQAGAPLAGGLTPAAALLAARAYDYLFFFLLAGSVPFVAATLFQGDDLPLLLTTPTDARAIVGAKLLDAAATNAVQSAALGVPVLVGMGWAAGPSPGGWLWLGAATLLLLAVPPLATALLLLAAAQALGMRRVRVAVTVVSVGLGLAITSLAVVGASRAAQGGGLDVAHLQSILRGEPKLEDGPPAPSLGSQNDRSQERMLKTTSSHAPQNWGGGAFLPSAWAARMLRDTAGGHSLSAGGWKGFIALLAAAWLLTALCLPLGARVLTSDAFLEPLDSGRVPAGRALVRRGWTRALSSATWGLLAKDGRYLQRDLVLLGQIGTALLLFLVPLLLRAAQGGSSPQDADLYAALSLGMLGLILYMVTSIVSLTSVGLEGRGAWIVLASPIGRGAFVRAKWLGSFALSAGLTGVLILASWPLFGLTAGQVRAAFLCLGPACFALSGLGVGLAALFPRFVYENPAHRASVWALLLGFVLATVYAALCGLLGFGAYLLTAQNVMGGRTAILLGGGLFAALSLATGLVPILLAGRRLRDYEWEF